VANRAFHVEKALPRESNRVAGETRSRMRRERRKLAPRFVDFRKRFFPRFASATGTAGEKEEPQEP
jgi:hypothetical protein